MISTAEAVMSLRPNTEWTMTAEDVENIIWHTEGVEPLTQAEVDAEVARLEQAAIDEATQREENLASAMEKLTALGLNQNEIKALTGE